jgi:hypothetical protein
MNQMLKQIEKDQDVLNLYERTIRDLCLKAHRVGIRQPFQVEFSDAETDQIFYVAGVWFLGNQLKFQRTFPQHRGKVIVSLREHTRVARTIDTRQIEESEGS